MEIEDITFTESEFEEILFQLHFFTRLAYHRDEKERLSEISLDMYEFDKKTKKYAINYNAFYERPSSFYHEILRESMFHIGGFICKFGSLFVFDDLCIFPFPMEVSEDGSYNIWGYFHHTSPRDYDFLITMSEMLSKRVSKEDLPSRMADYFDVRTVEAYFGLDIAITYKFAIKKLLKENYQYEYQEDIKSDFIKYLYDSWESHYLGGRDITKNKKVAMLWEKTFHGDLMLNLDALRELAYIESDTPSILTYTNLYEKGIESDFGHAILKTLKRKKEVESLRRTLTPMERCIGIKGVPYEVPVGLDDFITRLDYGKIYWEVLKDILRKLKAVR